MATCGSCGEDVPPRFRFCGVCGTPVPEQITPQREVRKTVTVLFCDVVDSTRLGARLDPESLRQVMGRYFEVARETLQRHGGTVEKFIGDAVMGVFGIPVLHEDDALRAVRAADDLRTAVSGLNADLARDWGVELTLRMGVNTGQVIAGDPAGGQTLVTGDAVNVAARLEQAAAAGDVLIGPVTCNLVRDAVVAEAVGGLDLKGKDAPVVAYRLVSVTPRAAGRARRVDTPIVGRTRERELLSRAFDRAVAENGCHLFTVLGPAGVGKSRLVHEVVSDLRSRATVLRGRCLDYGEGITFWPVVEVVRDALGATEGDGPEVLLPLLRNRLQDEPHGDLVADRVAALAGSDETASRADEVPWAVRTFLEALARERPLVVVLDDLHWAEATLLDLVEHVADWSRDVPILLLCVARPELLDVRAGWAGGKLNATSILLEPLTATDSAALVGNLLGEIEDGEAVRSRITEAAEGNPLFVEELVAMLVEDGLLVRHGDRWTATTDLRSAAIPPTISALLAARLDRLAEQERSVIERASVVGKTFYRTAVAELSPSAVRSDVAHSLMTLVRKELIRPDRSGLAGDDAFRFRHLLIRDAAYAALPRRERAELHERFAEWLSEAAAGRVGQFEEIIGHHLEQAARQRAELGLRDARHADLSRRATERLSSAGRRALCLSDLPAAIGLLDRAARVAPPEQRPSVTADLVDALVHAGRLEEACAVLDGVEPAGTPRGGALLALARAQVRVETGESGIAALEEDLHRVLDTLEGADDGTYRTRALLVLARVHWTQGYIRRAEEVMRRALAEARATGDGRSAATALSQLAFYALIGSTPVDDAADLCTALLAEVGDDRPTRASLLKTLSGTYCLRGDFARSRQLAAESTAIFEELGLRLAAAHASVEFAIRELLAGDPIAAEAAARRGFEQLEAMGETSYQGSCAALLARALHLQGMHHEAGRFADLCRRLADTDDVFSQSEWRAAWAGVGAATGRTEEALQLAQEAVALLAPTDLDFLHGDALVDRAQILRSAGRLTEAARDVEAALALYERKGATVARDRARLLLEELSDEQFAQV